MRAGTVSRIETSVEAGSAAIFAGAVAFAAFHLVQGAVGERGLAAVTAGAAAVAYLLCGATLKRLTSEQPRFPFSVFDVSEIDFTDCDELLLTDAERVPPSASRDVGDRVDQIAAEISADSRVVRLFDPAAMPSPEQLKDRIDQQLDGGASPPPSPDASQALYDALSELRRSLR
jgi:hypothetical protein